MLQAILGFGGKALYTGALLAIAVICVLEIYKLWMDTSLTIRPFEYNRAGTLVETNGVAFVKHLEQEQRTLLDLFRTVPEGTRTDSATLLYDLNWVIDPYILATVDTIELTTLKFELGGLNVTALLRQLRDWIRQPKVVEGRIDEEKGAFMVFAEWHCPAQTQYGNFLYHAQHTNLRDARLELAAHLLWCSIVDPKNTDGLVKQISDLGPKRFTTFVRAWIILYYARTGRTVPHADIGEAKEALDSLLAQDVAFPPLYLLAAELRVVVKPYGSLSESSQQEVVALREKYVSSSNQAGVEAAEVKEWLASTSPIGGRGADSGNIVVPGSSISIENQRGVGSVCCIVTDNSASKYILTADYLISQENTILRKPLSVYVPAHTDLDNREVGVFDFGQEKAFGYLSNGDNGVVLIPLKRDVVAKNDLKDRATIEGLQDTIQPGEVVNIYGRSSGIKTAKVLAVSVRVGGQANTAPKALFNEGMISIEKVSSPGDGGAAVVTSDNKLLGIVYASSQDATLVLPTARIFKELQINLAN